MSRTKTNFQAVQELQGKYVPAARGIVSKTEESLIRDVLEIGTRDDLELQDIRDAAVMLYGQMANSGDQTPDGIKKTMELMDAMSGVCGVIDAEKNTRGLPV